MDKINEHSKGESSSTPDGWNHLIMPKPELFDFNLPPQSTYSAQLGDSVASSSRGNLRSSLIGMGFLPSLVDKVIDQNGEEHIDLLVDILIELSDPPKSKSQSSGSLNGLFDDKDVGCHDNSSFVEPKEESDVLDTVDDEKRACLLNMNFSVDEIEFAMDKLGEHAPVDEIVDFISATQIAQNFGGETDDMTNNDVEVNEDCSDETLFGTMEKTIRLLELGFSENEVSLAIEKLGSDVPVSELAEAICAYQVGEIYVKRKKHSSKNFSENYENVATNSRSFNLGMKNEPIDCSDGAVRIRCNNVFPQSRDMNTVEARKGKRPKDEYMAEYPDAEFTNIDFEEDYKGKRPKEEDGDYLCSYSETSWLEEKVEPPIMEMPKGLKSNSCRSLDRMVAKPPYFFYGNVVTVSFDIWGKISQFLYAIEPEFVNTNFFSALSRQEGYIHNLPVENRFHILPKSPMTLIDALPHMKKWWPSWDTRKHLSSLSFEIGGVSQLCDRLGRTLTECRGLTSSQQKRQILHHCQKLNLMWVGPHKLCPIEPEDLELILGYPMNHTQDAEISSLERLRTLSRCFQIDTLGYHISVLKSMYPGGITMLSLFSGIGGAEVALHRLGVHLKAVVSVETSETNRKILRSWWHCSRQTGLLEQIEDIQKLTSSKLEKLIEKLGGFDFIICQNSFTHTSKVVKTGPYAQPPPAFDFPLFYEFVRVLQRVRNTMERRS